MAARIKKGDLVAVVAGADKGMRGHVLKVLGERVIVEGVRRIKRHQSPRQYREGGIVEREAPIHISNVMPIDPQTDKPTRIRAGEDQDGTKVRLAMSGGNIDQEQA
jgi:large subunit ribosomal protein L24